MITFCLVIGSLYVKAEESTQVNLLSSPAKELVLVIYNFCIERYSEHEEANIDNYLLNCVNGDLEVSAYEPFESQSELRRFLEKSKEDK